MKRKAFTLVELLVVIGIICLILAIVLPIMSPAIKVQGTVTNKIQRLAGRGGATRIDIIEVSTPKGPVEYKTTENDLYNSIVVGGVYSFGIKRDIFIVEAKLISLPLEKK
jgi:prepilin-type N-terminal cleavage/methylation domain-containing protein